MGIELRLPNITGDERAQLAQIRSYLYQIVPQLQWALNNINPTGVSSESVEQIVRRISAPSSTPSSSVSAEVTFDKLKPLIIKSAEIVEAYYEEINKRLQGQYVADSVFGTFIETTELNIKETSKYVDQKFSDVQVITNEIDGEIEEINSSIDKSNSVIASLQDTLIETTAHIRSGILYYENEIPVYGLEVGQKNIVDGVEVFNRYARFTSDRLSFYDSNGTEVAYISDYRLYITNADFTGTVTFGAFRLDTTKGFNLKYVGRG